MRSAAVLFLLGMTACCGAKGPEPQVPMGTSKETISFSATVRITPSDPGHRLLLVVLEAEGGTRWVASYRADDLWKAFADKRVIVTGQRYEPEGQALVMPHLRAETWRIDHPTPEDSIVEVGPEVTLRGRFDEHVWPQGTKLAGERAIRFYYATDASYPLANETPTVLRRDVEVHGRLVKASPFSAHEGGPFLWTLSVASGDTSRP